MENLKSIVLSHLSDAKIELHTNDADLKVIALLRIEFVKSLINKLSPSLEIELDQDFEHFLHNNRIN
ncbi:MAG: hypothetical protein ACNS62_22365 [Candidatus Cyclobacteriaceae bacterium M3_2C_046]